MTQSSNVSGGLRPSHLCGGVRAQASSRLDHAKAAHDVLGAQRVGEVVAAVVDAGEPGTHEELVTERLLPHLLHPRDLREEAVTAEVEAEPVVLDGLRDTSDLGIRLEHYARMATGANHMSRGESGWTGTEYRDAG